MRWRWLIVLGLSLMLVGPSRADVDLSGVYLLRPEHPARYRVTQRGAEVQVYFDDAYDPLRASELIFEGQLAPGTSGNGKVTGKYKRDGTWVAAVLAFQVGDNYRNFAITSAGGDKLLAMVHASDPVDKPATVEFIDEQGKPTDPVAGFSQPAPTVSLDKVTKASLQVVNGIARFTLSGTVRSDLAEIVADGRANITKVMVEYASGQPDDAMVTHSVPVNVQATPPPSGSRRPFGFTGRFTTQVEVPLADMGTQVAVRATDLTGGSGYDSITIHVRSKTWGKQTVGKSEVFDPAPAGPADLADVIEGESTAPGTFQPVWLRVTGAQPAPELDVGGKKLKLVPRGDERVSELPFIAVNGDPPNGAINIVAAKKPLVVRHGAAEHKLGWATTQRIYAYAAGTEVNHSFEWPEFPGWVVDKVVPLRKEPRGQGWAWIADQDNVTVVEHAVTGTTARVKLRLGKNAWQVRDKGLQFFLHSRAAPAVIRAPVVSEYKAVPLRTVIVAVDGLAEPFATEGPTFARLFGGGGGAVRETALSALPTITWCNWAGVMTGVPPARHGVLGNSFFSRDKPLQSQRPDRPTASDTRTTFLSLVQGFSAVVWGLDEHTIGGVGSIYDAIAMASRPQRFPLNVYSINMWYRATHDNRVTVHEGRFHLLLRGLAHGPDAARLLDRWSGNDAERRYEANRDAVDVMTVYFAGPDNVAHSIGDRKLPRPGEGEYKDYTSGPALPDVTLPLRSIGEHAAKHTDPQLARLVKVIDDAGYLHATLFVLVADHGLHAFRKDDRVIRADGPRGLGALFDDMGLKLWTGGMPGPLGMFADVDNYDLVYAPNGGLAHLYIRNGTVTKRTVANVTVEDKAKWQVAPRRQDVARVARQLFIEAMGGNAGAPARNFPPCGNNDLRTSRACFANRTMLGQTDANHRGALGNPPAIFVRMPGEPTTSYRWLSGVAPPPGATQEQLDAGADLQWLPIADFLRHQTRSWPAFEARLEEMNHTLRTGEIVMIMNGPEGYLAVNRGDELDGWHGGPEISESFVPLFFNIPDDVVNERFVSDAVQAVKRTRPAMDQQLRNWQMGPILAEIYRQLYH